MNSIVQPIANEANIANGANNHNGHSEKVQKRRSRLQINDSDEENGKVDHQEQSQNEQESLNNLEEIKKSIDDDLTSVKSKDLEQLDIEEVELLEEEESEAGEDSVKEKKRKVKKQVDVLDDDDFIFVEKLPKNIPLLKKLKEKLEQKIRQYKVKYLQESFENESKRSKIADNAVPICADIRTFNFSKLREEQLGNVGRLFDGINQI